MKVCAKCKNEKPESEFYKSQYRCKSCCRVDDSQRNSTDERIRQKRETQRKRRKELQLRWRDYFESAYGEFPCCQVCSKSLEWFSDKQSKRAIFDHRHGGTEPIKESPTRWLVQHQPNEENVATWQQCDFGILCDRCNRFLPTENRAEWFELASRYIQDSYSTL